MFLTIVSVIGAALITFGVVLATREHAWLQKAQIGPGIVVGLVVKHGPKGRQTFTPRVQYTALDGSIHDFVGNYGSRPGRFNVGEDVHVAYDPHTFEGRILTFSQRFGSAAVMVIIGLSLVLTKVTFSLGNQWVPCIYLTQAGEGSIKRAH